MNAQTLRSQSLALAKQIYGQESQNYKQIEALSNQTLENIQSIIDHAIANQTDFNGVASNQDVTAITNQLTKMRQSAMPEDAILFIIYFGNTKIKTNGDVLSANIGKELINMTIQQRSLVAKTLISIDNAIKDNYSSIETQETTSQIHHDESNILNNNFKAPTVQGTRYNYAKSIFDNSQNMYRNSQNVIKQIINAHYSSSGTSLGNSDKDNLVKYVVDNNKRPIDYVDEMKKIVNSNASSAQKILRTEASSEYSDQMNNLMSANNIQQYEIMANGTDNVCSECQDLDGNVYNVSEMQIGLTAPPFHPNCQCNIVMLPNK